MAKSTFWREKVVHNSIAVVLTLLTTFHANTQSLQLSKITYTCKSTELETVISDLSKLTGVSFVYSSDKITTSTPVTISVKDRSLSDVLGLIGKQLNLSFKIQDQHITVKSNRVPFSPPLVETISLNKMQMAKQIASKEVLATTKPYVPINSEKMRRATDLSPNNGDVSQYLVKLQSYFNPSFLKNMPVFHVKSTSRNMNYHRWFLAAGPVVNSYSTGVEVQAGLQKLYVVFSPSWMPNDKYHGAFGVGTTLQFSNAISLKPIYTYASLKESTTIGSATGIGNEPSYKVNTTVSHHQVKLMLQYAFTRKFSFRAGPTFNQSRSISKYYPVETTTSSTGDFVHRLPGGMEVTGSHNIHTNHISQNPADATTDKFWIGWEAAFAYRINF